MTDEQALILLLLLGLAYMTAGLLKANVGLVLVSVLVICGLTAIFEPVSIEDVLVAVGMAAVPYVIGLGVRFLTVLAGRQQW